MVVGGVRLCELWGFSVVVPVIPFAGELAGGGYWEGLAERGSPLQRARDPEQIDSLLSALQLQPKPND